MLNYENQLNLGNIYSNCKEIFKEQRPEFLELLDKYIDVNSYIPFSFKKAFYADTGRPRECSLYGYISALIFQKIFNIPTINRLKTYYRINSIDKSTDDIYKQAFISLPKVASSDSSIRKMYANRSFLLW